MNKEEFVEAYMKLTPYNQGMLDALNEFQKVILDFYVHCAKNIEPLKKMPRVEVIEWFAKEIAGRMQVEKERILNDNSIEKNND